MAPDRVAYPLVQGGGVLSLGEDRFSEGAGRVASLRSFLDQEDHLQGARRVHRVNRIASSRGGLCRSATSWGVTKSVTNGSRRGATACTPAHTTDASPEGARLRIYNESCDPPRGI